MPQDLNVQLFIDGTWRPGAGSRTLDVIDPATEEVIGKVARAEIADLNAAVTAAERGFALWRATPAFERGKILHRAAAILRERIAPIAALMTREQGKPVKEAKVEIAVAADTLDWFAEETRRSYGRVVPARAPNITNLVLKEPVGPVAAVTPWNFPVNQIARKLGAALAAGCSIIVKAPEEAPASAAEFFRVLAEAGVPAGVVNLVFGVPAEISAHLIPHPAIRKISFTGSTAVGKELAALAGAHMKRATMELGGHAPAIVFADADLDVALRVLLARKFRNAGQACTAPTRFLVQRDVYPAFLARFAAAAEALKVGSGRDPATDVGPLANPRRLAALQGYVADAVEKGAKLVTGGTRLGDQGYFFAPTVLAHVPISARAMNEEPFGPLALVNAFNTIDEAVAEANRLAYGLASYAFTASAATADALAQKIEAGMVAINDSHLSSPELPIGGVKDSGYGSEGGPEAVEAYLVTKLVTQAAG